MICPLQDSGHWPPEMCPELDTEPFVCVELRAVAVAFTGMTFTSNIPHTLQTMLGLLPPPHLISSMSYCK